MKRVRGIDLFVIPYNVYSASKGSWKLPATTPGMVISSSKFSHRRAKPFNRKLTSFSSVVDASFDYE